MHTGTTPPNGPNVGDLWHDPFTGGLYMWNGAKWIFWASVDKDEYTFNNNHETKEDKKLTPEEKWKQVMGEINE